MSSAHQALRQVQDFLQAGYRTAVDLDLAKFFDRVNHDVLVLRAIFTAISRKSYWHLSKTLATQSGMTNEWLSKQGLLSIRELWMKAHGYA